MLEIRSFFCEIFKVLVKMTKKNYRSCAVVMTGTALVAVIALNSASFHAGGKNRIKAMHRVVTDEEYDIKEKDTKEKIYDKAEEELIISKEIKEAKEMKNVSDSAILAHEKKIEDIKAEDIKAEDIKAKDIKTKDIEEISEKKQIYFSEKEIEALGKIIEAEAATEDLKGKILVGNVIMNRVRDDAFPDTVMDVIFHKAGGDIQFSPIADGRYYSVEVSDETKQAIECIMNGEDYSEGAMYFSARDKANPDNMQWFDSNLEWLFKHGGHEFYK